LDKSLEFDHYGRERLDRTESGGFTFRHPLFQNMARFPILMYHRIVSEKCPVPGGDPDEVRYAVDLDEFRWQMNHIAGAGRRGVSMKQAYDLLERGGRVPSEWVVLTFDDGNLSDFVHALPIFKQLEFTATFFVGGNRVGADGGVEPEMLAELSENGMDIGSHGMTHRFLTALDAGDEEEELSRSKSLLERAAGEEVLFFAPPGGRIGRRGIVALRRLSYRAVCTSVFGFNSCSRRRFEYRRIPVTAATTRPRFGQFLDAAAPRLLSLYARDRVLRLAKKVLGEAGYKRIRSLGVGS
jgi:peptidoglycan/xylan/chitin deacetylase (PgdA/CDA1 family)